jgi:hypothetical protein
MTRQTRVPGCLAWYPRSLRMYMLTVHFFPEFTDRLLIFQRIDVNVNVRDFWKMIAEVNRP